MTETEITKILAEFAKTQADLCERVAALEARLARKRPDTTGRRRTRRDRCPFGSRPHPAENSTRLIQDGVEQKTIQYIIEAARNPAMGLRAICRYLDELGLKRRGKKWARPSAHGLVKAILERERHCDRQRRGASCERAYSGTG
jgi:hypothetical protein